MYQPDRTDWKIISPLKKDWCRSGAEIAYQQGDVSTLNFTNFFDLLTVNSAIKIHPIVNPGVPGDGVQADVSVEVEPGWICETA